MNNKVQRFAHSSSTYFGKQRATRWEAVHLCHLPLLLGMQTGQLWIETHWSSFQEWEGTEWVPVPSKDRFRNTSTRAYKYDLIWPKIYQEDVQNHLQVCVSSTLFTHTHALYTIALSLIFALWVSFRGLEKKDNEKTCKKNALLKLHFRSEGVLIIGVQERGQSKEFRAWPLSYISGVFLSPAGPRLAGSLRWPPSVEPHWPTSNLLYGPVQLFKEISPSCGVQVQTASF